MANAWMLGFHQAPQRATALERTAKRMARTRLDSTPLGRLSPERTNHNMKTTNTKNTKNIAQSKADDDFQYRLRTECQSDCLQVRAVLGSWLTSWREDQCQIEDGKGKLVRIPDQDAFFSVQADAPSLAEIRWLLDCLVDCHVAAESVNTAAAYDGERLYYDKLDELKRRPSDKVITQARDGVARTKAGFQHEFRKLDEATEGLDTELKGAEAVLARRLANTVRFWAEAVNEAVTPEEKKQAVNMLKLVGASAMANSKPGASHI